MKMVADGTVVTMYNFLRTFPSFLHPIQIILH